MKWHTKLRRWTWELPQSLLGATLLCFYRKHLLGTLEYKGQKIYNYSKFPGGISLGYYTLIRASKYHFDNRVLTNTIKHESGHGVQSKWLGPLYLPTVGLLSITHNIVCRMKNSRGIRYDYYKFFVEKSADKLGGVNRY